MGNYTAANVFVTCGQEIKGLQVARKIRLHLSWRSDIEFLTLDPPHCLVYGKDSTSPVPPTRTAFMSITEQTLRIGDKVVYPNHGVGAIE